MYLFKSQEADGKDPVTLIHMRYGLAVRSHHLLMLDRMVTEAFDYAFTGKTHGRSGIKGLKCNIGDLVGAMFWPGDSFYTICNPNGTITGKVHTHISYTYTSNKNYKYTCIIFIN